MVINDLAIQKNGIYLQNNVKHESLYFEDILFSIFQT